MGSDNQTQIVKIINFQKFRSLYLMNLFVDRYQQNQEQKIKEGVTIILNMNLIISFLYIIYSKKT